MEPRVEINNNNFLSYKDIDNFKKMKHFFCMLNHDKMFSFYFN